MSLTFIHTADWQLGRQFKSFDPRIAGQLEDARFDVIDTIANVAREATAGHVLVAGDVFDAPDLPGLVLRKAMERLARRDHVHWHLLPGNHDYAQTAGIWDRVRALGLPPNVQVHDNPASHELIPSVALLAAPLRARSHSGDPTAWFDSAPTAPGTLRIGLAHGSVQDFGAQGESSVKIDPLRAERAGLAYLALGDWHGQVEVNSRTWYSGTPEPDRFADNASGFALIVRVSSSARRPDVKPIRTARYTWQQHDAEIGAHSDLEQLVARVTAPVADLTRLILRMRLRGCLPVAECIALSAARERIEAKVKCLDWDEAALTYSTAAADLDKLGRNDELRAAADVLAAMANDPADIRAPLAQRALSRLFALSAASAESS